MGVEAKQAQQVDDAIKKAVPYDIATKLGYDWKKDRQDLAKKAGIDNYSGKADENLKIKSMLIKENKEKLEQEMTKFVKQNKQIESIRVAEEKDKKNPDNDLPDMDLAYEEESNKSMSLAPGVESLIQERDLQETRIKGVYTKYGTSRMKDGLFIFDKDGNAYNILDLDRGYDLMSSYGGFQQPINGLPKEIQEFKDKYLKVYNKIIEEEMDMPAQDWNDIKNIPKDELISRQKLKSLSEVNGLQYSIGSSDNIDLGVWLRGFSTTGGGTAYVSKATKRVKVSDYGPEFVKGDYKDLEDFVLSKVYLTPLDAAYGELKLVELLRPGGGNTPTGYGGDAGVAALRERGLPQLQKKSYTYEDIFSTSELNNPIIKDWIKAMGDDLDFELSVDDIGDDNVGDVVLKFKDLDQTYTTDHHNLFRSFGSRYGSKTSGVNEVNYKKFIRNSIIEEAKKKHKESLKRNA